jgi:hypothetical protein
LRGHNKTTGREGDDSPGENISGQEHFVEVAASERMNLNINEVGKSEWALDFADGLGKLCHLVIGGNLGLS